MTENNTALQDFIFGVLDSNPGITPDQLMKETLTCRAMFADMSLAPACSASSLVSTLQDMEDERIICRLEAPDYWDDPQDALYIIDNSTHRRDAATRFLRGELQHKGRLGAIFLLGAISDAIAELYRAGSILAYMLPTIPPEDGSRDQEVDA